MEILTKHLSHQRVVPLTIPHILHACQKVSLEISPEATVVRHRSVSLSTSTKWDFCAIKVARLLQTWIREFDPMFIVYFWTRRLRTSRSQDRRFSRLKYYLLPRQRIYHKTVERSNKWDFDLWDEKIKHPSMVWFFDGEYQVGLSRNGRFSVPTKDVFLIFGPCNQKKTAFYWSKDFCLEHTSHGSGVYHSPSELKKKS